MVVAENEAGDDGRDLNGGPKSPWKTPAALDAKVAGAVDGPVMGAESWPALADAQRPKSNPDLAKLPSSTEAAGLPPNLAAPAPQSPSAVQVSTAFSSFLNLCRCLLKPNVLTMSFV